MAIFNYWQSIPYTSAQVARELAYARQERLLMTYRMVTRTWTGYKQKPEKIPQEIWNRIVERFTMIDLASPVARTIKSAAYGGKIRRTLKKSVSSKEEIERFKLLADYEGWIERLFYESSLYGTSYGDVGFKNGGQPSLAIVPPIATEIDTDEDDVTQIQAIIVYFEGFSRRYTPFGTFVDYGHSITGRKYVPNTDYGFIPILIGRAQHLDASTPYSEGDVWPAVEEGKQITFLGNDTMVLAKQQSFSTLVQKGDTVKNADETSNGPFTLFKIENEGDMKYISPDAKISELDDLIAKKYERTATQCNVPVEIFTKANSGTNQAAQSALLTHKPLYDLVMARQKQWKNTERYAHALIDARIQYRKHGRPIPFDEILANLEIEIVYENEANPALTQNDAQTYTMLMDANLLTHEKAYWHINPDGTPEEQKELQADREERMTLELQPPSADPADSDPETQAAA